jgi:gliding motility-associated-like protein
MGDLHLLKNLKYLKLLIPVVCVFYGSTGCNAQILLLPDSIFMSQPALTNGEYLSTDYSTVNKPLVLESFSNNSKVGVTSGSVYAPAAGRDSVLFGGDEPSNLGALASPMFTTAVFNKSDFPITMKCDFYSRQDVPLYNESYFTLVPADYKYFSSPTYNVNSRSNQKEGILIGGRPYQSFILDNRGWSESLVKKIDVTHYWASNGAWFTMEVLLDLRGDELIMSYFKVNGNEVFSSDFNLGPLAYLDNFRLGIVVDDLAHGFTVIKENLDPIIADFSYPLEICENECVDFIDRSIVPSGVNNVSYQWQFIGADSNSSILQNPSNICYSKPGNYPVVLIVSTDFQKDTIKGYILVKPLPEIDLGTDTVACELGFLLNAEYPSAAYQWSDGSNRSSLLVENEGDYWVQINVEGCLFSDTLNVLLKKKDDVVLMDDTSMCEGEPIVVGTNLPSDWSRYWRGINQRQVLISESWTLILEGFDGCWEYRDTVNISFGKCTNFRMHVPNAFTPNGDVYNATFRPIVPEGVCCTIRDFEMQIFNRWGELLFESTSIDDGWDGSYIGIESQMGVYLCIIRFRQGLKMESQKHSIHLIR